MAQAMPLLPNVKPEEVGYLLVTSGYESIKLVDMNAVCKAEYGAMPLRYRLAYSHERYTITAIKPNIHYK